jgi:hypothetical protein
MRSGDFENFARVCLLYVGVLALALGTQAEAQQGYNAVYNSTGTAPTPSAAFIDASQFSGADICAKIASAWSYAITTRGFTGATIDARGITGGQTCAASPFPSGVSVAGELLLGNVQISTSVSWQIPARVHVVGIGVSPLFDTGSNFENTDIRAASSSILSACMPSGAPACVIQLGTGSGTQFDIQVKGLTVDANGTAVGILNNSAEEGSMVEDVYIFNASSVGLLIQAATGSGADNSGPYRNINIQYSCSTCGGTSTTGIEVSLFTGTAAKSSGIRGIDNVTVSGYGTAGQQIGSCIAVTNYPVQITNSHLEYCTAGIQIGASGGSPTGNVEAQNISICCSSSGVTITNSEDISLSGIAVTGTHLLDDTVTGNVITGSSTTTNYLGYYLLGDNTGSSPAVITTNAATTPGGTSYLTWVAPGNLDILEHLSKGSGTFKIDDPLDPTQKYLYHSFVESPDMMNVYNGVVTTDRHGRATINLPAYFEALNKDFRYQLTPIGSFTQATVVSEVANNRFTIRTSKPAVKVSWQVTGIRHDAYADRHRIQVEEEKPLRERGNYLHPEVAPSAALPPGTSH